MSKLIQENWNINSDTLLWQSFATRKLGSRMCAKAAIRIVWRISKVPTLIRIVAQGFRKPEPEPSPCSVDFCLPHIREETIGCVVYPRNSLKEKGLILLFLTSLWQNEIFRG